MKAVKADLSKDIDTLRIHTFADWHIGDKHCDLKLVKAQINDVIENKNDYVILNGDLCNNATKTSVSDSYAETIPPMKQIALLVDLLKPIKDRILIATQGNHEARTYRTDGIDLTALICSELGIKDKYVREGGMLFLRFGTQSCNKKRTGHEDEVRSMCYTLYVTHGSGGGRKEGAKAIRLADMASIVDADVYIHAHTHLPMVIKEAYFRTDCRNSTVGVVDKLFVNTAAKLHYGGYGQSFEFKPSSLATPIILLNGKKKQFTAKL